MDARQEQPGDFSGGRSVLSSVLCFFESKAGQVVEPKARQHKELEVSRRISASLALMQAINMDWLI